MTAETHKASVFATVRDGEACIEAMIRSVFAGNGEAVTGMVIVDDGSSDRTRGIVEALAREYPIELIPTDGIGRGRALNRAWRATTGRYVCNVDADDLFAPGKVRRQLEVFREHPEVALVATAERQVRSDADARAVCTAEFPAQVEVKTLSRRGLARRNPICHSSVMLDRGWLEAVGGYAEDRRSQVDYDLWIRLAERGATFMRLEAELTGKRVHGGQHFEARQRMRYLLSSLAVQLRAVWRLDRRPASLFWAFCRFGYGFLPRGLRARARRSRQPRW